MALSNEWTEYHLTKSGWIEGSCKLDIVGKKEVPKPDKTLITRKYMEYASSRFSGLELTYQETVFSGNKEVRESLLKKFPHPEPISHHERFQLV